ncbi:MAG TPA: methyltransferase domain-containing protein, partial [Ktedonobacteraceae bacterium]|nr:methyltransferase domain-containing protein [Ktedonobacteraceae bacterium]
MRKDLHEENRLSWNAATLAHNSHKGDQAAFFRNGGSTLRPEERELLGNAEGLSIVHLQCNSGQDTLSIARLGATVTGVDISDTAIDFARQLSQDSGIPATWQRMDVYDWLEETVQSEQRFDIVFCSYGAICWLSNLDGWARGINNILKPGGRFITVEFHPVMGMFNEKLERIYDYFVGGQPFTWEEGVSDYVAVSREGLTSEHSLEGIKDFKNPHRVHEFFWGIGQIVTALLTAGLQLTALKEYPYSNGFKPFDQMQALPDRRWSVPEGQPNMPLM